MFPGLIFYVGTHKTKIIQLDLLQINSGET